MRSLSINKRIKTPYSHAFLVIPSVFLLSLFKLPSLLSTLNFGFYHFLPVHTCLTIVLFACAKPDLLQLSAPVPRMTSCSYIRSRSSTAEKLFRQGHII